MPLARPRSARRDPRLSRPLRVSLLTVLTDLRESNGYKPCTGTFEGNPVTGNDGICAATKSVQTFATQEERGTVLGYVPVAIIVLQ